jgi:hypothetical protein
MVKVSMAMFDYHGQVALTRGWISFLSMHFEDTDAYCINQAPSIIWSLAA